MHGRSWSTCSTASGLQHRNNSHSCAIYYEDRASVEGPSRLRSDSGDRTWLVGRVAPLLTTPLRSCSWSCLLFGERQSVGACSCTHCRKGSCDPSACIWSTGFPLVVGDVKHACRRECTAVLPAAWLTGPTPKLAFLQGDTAVGSQSVLWTSCQPTAAVLASPSR